MRNHKKLFTILLIIPALYFLNYSNIITLQNIYNYIKYPFYLIPASLHPDNYKLSYSLAVSEKKCGFTEPAEKHLWKSIHLKPDYPQSYIELGRIYNSRGEFSKASEALKKAYELTAFEESKGTDTSKLKAEALSELSEAFYGLNDIDSAVKYILEAVDLDKSNNIYYRKCGLYYFHSDKLGLSEVYLKKAAEINPIDYDSMEILCRIYDKWGNKELKDMYYKRIPKWKKAGLTTLKSS